ncbi:MAG: glycosyltransferase family 1 protein [Thermoanaerobaculia bacterium]|jgi:glycosyltransferase involved in cell wall biosynthesis
MLVTFLRDFIEDGRTSMEGYSDNLVAQLSERHSDEFAIREFRPVLGRAALLPDALNLRMRVARYVSYPQQVRRLGNGGVFHILDHGYAHLMSVIDPRRTVLTVHDIIPILAGRGLIAGLPSMRRNWLAEWTATFYRRAARIVADSESTKNDLIRFCACDPGRIDVIHPGVDPAYRPLEAAERLAARQVLGLPVDDKLVLVIGGAYYKNHATSVRVMARLSTRLERLRLVYLGGPSRHWDDAVRGSSIRDSVIELPFVRPAQMVQLYNAVDCLLFPSWYEGFGLPPLEAMACGTPAVTSSSASLPEVGGDTALTAAPDDIEQLALHVERLLNDSQFRAAVVDRGLQQRQRFDWAQGCSRLAEIYRQVEGSRAA